MLARPPLPPPPHPPRRKPPAPALAALAAPPAGASGLVVSGERAWQRKSLGGFLGGAGPGMPASDARQGGRVPSPLNLPYRARIIKNTPAPPEPAPGCVAHRVGGGQRSAGAGRVRRAPAGEGGLAPPTPQRRSFTHAPLPPPRGSPGLPAPRAPRAESPGGGGDADTAPPRRNSPLRWSTSRLPGSRVTRLARARATSPLCLCKRFSAGREET